MSEQAAGVKQRQTAPPRRSWLAGPQSKEARDRERLGWLLVLPTVLGVVLVALYPVANTFYLSLTNARLRRNDEPEFIGLRHYGRLLTDGDFLNAVTNTLTFTVFSVFFEMILGLIVALVINSNFKGRGLMRTAMLIPWAIPTVVSARMWTWMYNDVFGVVNDLLVNKIGLLDRPVAWLANPSLALPAIIAVDVWKTTPFVALLLLAGLQVIPGDVYEAGTVDGANRWQQFWRITLPLLRPALVVTLIFRTLDAFRVFDVIFTMRGTNPDTVSLAVLTRQTLFDLRRTGEGSAMAVIIFLILAIFVVIYTRIVRVEEA